MATLGGTVLNWKDLKDRMDPNGMPARIANVLDEAKPILNDIPWMESNQPLGHQSTIQVGLPTVGFKRINYGSVSSKGTVANIQDTMSMIEGFATTDIKALELYGNSNATRMGESRSFAESMAQLAVDTIWYGDVTDSIDEFNGFKVRYDTLSGNVQNSVLDAGASGDDIASVWLIGWGADKVYGLYPKNCMAGLRHKDWGEQLIQQDTDLGGRKLPAFVDQWTWDLGLCVKDWRYVVRIANIDLSDLAGYTGTQASNAYTTNLVFLMKTALRRIPNLASCRPIFYMPRSVAEGLDVQYLARTVENVWATKDVEGKLVDTFYNIPVRIEDALLNTEDEVTT